MSDPTARRGDNITALVKNMIESNRGWSEKQIKTFLFEKYRYGVTEQTLDKIFEQLKTHGIIYGKKSTKPPYIWFFPMVKMEALRSLKQNAHKEWSLKEVWSEYSWEM